MEHTLSHSLKHLSPACSAQQAEAQLRHVGVRATQARIQVLRALMQSPNAMSHQDLQDALPDDMDRVTLYRALECLTEAGLAHKIAGDDRIFRFSVGAEHAECHHDGKPHPPHQHGHFKCTECARIFCIDGTSEADILETVLPTSIKNPLQTALLQTLGKGFESHDVELTIKGWCAQCAKKHHHTHSK